MFGPHLPWRCASKGLEFVAFPKVGIEFGTDWVKFCLRLGGSSMDSGLVMQREQEREKLKAETWKIKCIHKTKDHEVQ